MNKLEYIASLSGRCPEGMVVEKYLSGGCVKCAKKKLETFKCGGAPKKRCKKGSAGIDLNKGATKNQEGGILDILTPFFKEGGDVKKRFLKGLSGVKTKKPLKKTPKINENDTIHVNKQPYAVSDRGHSAGYLYPLGKYNKWSQTDKDRYNKKFDKTHGSGV